MKFKDTTYGDLTGKTYRTGRVIKVINKKLTSLEGSPTESNDFNCSINELTSLEHAPIGVVGLFDCSYNHLTNLQHGPIIVTGNYNCSDNNITSLEGAPEKIGVSFSCSDNNLTSLKHAPKDIGGIFNCKFNKFENVKKEIIENRVKARQYITDDGDFKFYEIEDEFKQYEMLNKIQSKGFRTLLGLDK